MNASRSWYERASRVVAGGVSSDVRRSEKPFPLFFERGEGPYIFDVDGNRYIDYVLGQGPLLLGHSPRQVIEAVHAQLDKGLIFAAQHPQEVELAELICQVVPSAERVRFNSTGSEAVVSALRIARGARNRRLVIKFEGQWHGWYDSLFVSTSPPLDKAGPREAPIPYMQSRGQVANAVENLIVLPWNDLSLVEQVFAGRGDEIAAVLTEPIMINAGAIMPQPGFLEGLRRLCDQYGALLIFDEVITGFRVALGGAQAYFGVTPDLTTLAKGIAAGFTLSAVVGKAEFMDLVSRGEVAHAGTYNSNPVVIAAGLAAVKCLAADNGKIYHHLFAMGEMLSNGFRTILRQAGVPAIVNNIGPVVQVCLTDLPAMRDYRDYARRDVARYDRLVTELVYRGVRTISRGTWYISAAHTAEEINRTLEAFAEALTATMV
ncbi:MAG: aminotransferase class III-fold pyridoxal phosphate-dependent enzyme [Chloroflexi bacterium]|nr:aminotransferase class III-fold pyridoxal phosphate-dependent enzyme [Chloroflexota bacterium]